MIDLDKMQACIQDANPIPHIDNVDADELASFVAAANTRKAAILPAPTQQPDTMLPTTPLRRRRRGPVLVTGLAFLLVLGTLGAVALFGGEPEAPVVSELPPVTTKHRSLRSIITGWPNR